MAVTHNHREYEQRIDQWRRCRDCADGTDAVKRRGAVYLPRLSAQTVEEYDAYKNRALFYGATGRTIQGMSGLVFRKPPSFEIMDAYLHFTEKVTNDCVDLLQFSKSTVDEILKVGRIGLLVDHPSEEVTEPRPYVAVYLAEAIINWRTAVIDGMKMLTMVVLREEYEKLKGSDAFEMETKTQYRVLSLKFENGQRYYTQDVYREVKTQSGAITWGIDPNLSVIPLRNGQRIDHIPFFFINSNSLTDGTVKPPLLDLVDVNLSHYRTSADLEHGAHYTALPTPYAAGFDSESELRIGAGIAWVTENADARVGYLEFSGQGLDALSNLKKDKESLMAILGARLLEQQKKQAETAETMRIRQGGDAGSLQTIVGSVSRGIEMVLREMVWWAGGDENTVKGTTFLLNDDFISARMEPNELIALMKAWQSNAISQDTFLWNLRQGEIIPANTGIEDEKDKIDMEVGTSIEDNVGVARVGRSFDIRDENGNIVNITER